MPPSRRQVLRSGALSLTLLGGCVASDDAGTPGTTNSSTDTPTATSTDDPTTQPTAEPTTNDSDSPNLECGVGPLPESGWPLPDRSVGLTNYAPEASGPTSEPAMEWDVTTSESDTGGATFTRPVVADGNVFVGRVVYPAPGRQAPEVQHVHTYDAATGERRWRVEVPGRPERLAVAGTNVVVESGGAIRALDRESGKASWTYDHPNGVSGILPAPEGIVGGDRALAGTQSGGVLTVVGGYETANRLVALDSEGRKAWRVSLPARPSSNVAWVNDRAYFATSEAVLVAVDTANRRVAWTVNLVDGSDTAPVFVVATPCAVFAAVDGAIYTVTRDGEQAWSVEKGGRTLATDGEFVYTLDGNGYARAFTVSGGDEAWEAFYGIENWRKTDGFLWEPALDGETLYAGTLDGKLVAMSADDGSERWVIERGWENEASVSTVEGTLFAAWGRRLVAFR